MNMPTTPQPTPDFESLRKAIQEFRPNPHRVPFNSLKPFHEFIVMLRSKRASYRSVADLLEKHGVKTSRARVAEYGRIVLEGGKARKRRKRAKAVPVVDVPAPPQNAFAADAKPAPTTPASAAVVNLPPSPKENSAFVSRGPRIAKVEQLPPDEAKEFLASLTMGNAHIDK